MTTVRIKHTHLDNDMTELLLDAYDKFKLKICLKIDPKVGTQIISKFYGLVFCWIAFLA